MFIETTPMLPDLDTVRLSKVSTGCVSIRHIPGWSKGTLGQREQHTLAIIELPKNSIIGTRSREERPMLHTNYRTQILRSTSNVDFAHG